jgi:hypothetical protein
VTGEGDIRLVSDLPIGELASEGSWFIRIEDDLDALIRSDQKGRMTVPFDLHRNLLFAQNPGRWTMDGEP